LKEIKIFNFSVLIIFIIFITLIPNASAENFQINEECINDVLTLTMVDSEIPVRGISAYIYKDLGMTKIFDKVISDENGKIKIKFSDSTTMVKLNMEEHEEIIKNLVCVEEFRSQSMKVFSAMDSSLGLTTDPETGLHVIDTGSLFGVGGNGTIPDEIKIFKDGYLWRTIYKETSISPSTSHSEWQISQSFWNFLGVEGKYKLVLIKNNTETFVFEFLSKQIIEENNLKSKIDDENIINPKMTPLKQIANGVSPQEVICSEGFELIFKVTNGFPACIKPSNAMKLVERGWGTITPLPTAD